METLDERMNQLTTLVESIAATLREERKMLEDARVQFEKVGASLCVLLHYSNTCLYPGPASGACE